MAQFILDSHFAHALGALGLTTSKRNRTSESSLKTRIHLMSPPFNMYLTESGPSSARVLLKSDNDSSSSLSRSHTGNSSRSSLSRRRSKKSYWG
ncbi:hypothetical protein VNO77_27127 [Canavalia gladiata]|uniref:Uncharacterized protein n=1 Tax=Canavalia gladiata TaxID=3824 RepID=A0AAN9Q6U9_CANGL